MRNWRTITSRTAKRIHPLWKQQQQSRIPDTSISVKLSVRSIHRILCSITKRSDRKRRFSAMRGKRAVPMYFSKNAPTVFEPTPSNVQRPNACAGNKNQRQGLIMYINTDSFKTTTLTPLGTPHAVQVNSGLQQPHCNCCNSAGSNSARND